MNPSIIRFLWIFFLILLNFASAYISKRYNDVKNMYYTILFYLIGMCLTTVWIVVIKYSKNLMADSVLYDLILTLSFTSALVFVGCASHFNWINWVGLVLAMIGLVLLKIT